MTDQHLDPVAESLFSQLFENSPNPVGLVRDGRFFDCNQAMVDMFALDSRERIVGVRPGTELSPDKQPDGRDSAISGMEHMAECLEKGSAAFPWLSKRKNGELIHSKVELRRLDGSDPPVVVVYIRDVTAQTRVREQLEATEQRFQHLAQNAPAGIFIADAAGHCIYANPKTQELCGVFDKAVLGMGWMTHLHPDDQDRVLGKWKEFTQGNVPFATEYRFLRPDGSHVWVLGSAVPFEHSENGPARFLGTVSEITRIKRIEAELETSRNEALRANNAKSEFLSRMSHELRTPLNAILGFGQLLRLNNPEMPADQREAVDQILAGGEHLLGLIDDVLDLSRIETGDLSVDLQEVAAGNIANRSIALVTPLAKEAGVDIRLVANPSANIIADPNRLQQVLMNLLSNAIKYNHRGGRVEIRCQMPEPSRLRIHVADNGIGISPQDQTRIFKPFERLGNATESVEGTGIGLSLCKQLIELMGGHIGFSSVEGAGSDFWIDLPIAREQGNNGRAKKRPAQGER